MFPPPKKERNSKKKCVDNTFVNMLCAQQSIMGESPASTTINVSVLCGLFLYFAALRYSEAEIHIQGVVQSPVTLPCNTADASDIETVLWRLNSSSRPFLTYFAVDQFIVPSNHDPRYSIINDLHLVISSLNQSDSGKYECGVAAPSQTEILITKVALKVLDGCTLPHYDVNIFIDVEDCSPGHVLKYGKECEFLCKQGTQIVGSPSLKCTANGTLSASIPECENIQCRLSSIPPTLADDNGACHNGSLVHSGQSCSFQCEEEYILVGDRNITVLCLDNETFVGDIPSCKNEYEQVYEEKASVLWLTCLVSIPILVGIITVTYCIWKRRRKDIEDMGDDLCNFLYQQIGDDTATKLAILDILENSERKLATRLPGDIRQQRDEKQEYTLGQAFAWYVHVVIKCIESTNEDLATEVTNAVISTSGGKHTERRPSESTPLVTLDLTSSSGDDKNIEYLQMVHKAIGELLVAGRRDIPTSEERRRITAEVFHDMTLFLEEKYPPDPSEERKTLKSSTTASYPISQESKDGKDVQFNKYFVHMCLKNLLRCSTVQDEVEMRYRILHILIR